MGDAIYVLIRADNALYNLRNGQIQEEVLSNGTSMEPLNQKLMLFS
jgi:hypothetical protein